MKTILGLTGGTGNGKSAVAAYLKTKGAHIIDADKVAKQIMQPGMPALTKVAMAFDDVLLPDGSLNRKKLGRLVFADNEALCRLNAITHTYIIKEIETALSRSTADFIVIDAPLLFECGLKRLCTASACVLANQDIRKARIISRDNLTEQEAADRIESQQSEDYYKNRCDFILENNNSLLDLYRSIDIMLKELLH